MPFLAVYGRSMPRFGFVAAEHATDPASATFRLIDAAFARIAPRHVILEGFPHDWGDNPDHIVGLTKRRTDPAADAYARSEAVHAAARALEHGATFRGGEMSDEQQVALLVAQGFDRTDLLHIMLIKVLDQDQRGGAFASPEGAAFEASLARWGAALSSAYGAPPPTADAFAAWFENRFGVALNKDPDWVQRAWPGSQGLGGRIAQAQGLARDRYLLARIREALAATPPVLVVYGGSHLASLWAALEGDLGAPVIVGPEST
jgi:hypothetical protein